MVRYVWVGLGVVLGATGFSGILGLEMAWHLLISVETSCQQCPAVMSYRDFFDSFPSFW